MPFHRYSSQSGCCGVANRYIVILGNGSYPSSSSESKVVFIYDTKLKEIHKCTNIISTQRYNIDVVALNNVLYSIGSTGGLVNPIYKIVLCNSRELLPEVDNSND